MSHALPREWFGASIRNGSLKREKARLRAVSIVAYLAVVSVPVAALLFYIVQGVQVIRTGYEIDQLHERLQEARTERDRLEVELASLGSLAVVERLAVKELGMVSPSPGQVVAVQVVEPAGAPPAVEDGGAEKDEPSGSRLLVLLRRVTKAL